MTSFWVGVLAGYGIAIPVGAIAVLIVQIGMRCGFWCAASAGAGAATADLAYSVLAVAGGATLAAVVESVGRPVRWVSAGVWFCLRCKACIACDTSRILPRPRCPGGGSSPRLMSSSLV